MESDRYEDFIYEAEEEQPVQKRVKLKWKPRGGRGTNPTVSAERATRLAIQLERDIEYDRRQEEYAS